MITLPLSLQPLSFPTYNSLTLRSLSGAHPPPTSLGKSSFFTFDSGRHSSPYFFPQESRTYYRTLPLPNVKRSSISPLGLPFSPPDELSFPSLFPQSTRDLFPFAFPFGYSTNFGRIEQYTFVLQCPSPPTSKSCSNSEHGDQTRPPLH